MKTIWKFPVKINDEFSLAMPAGARVLSVQDQRGGTVMWALVDDSAPKVERRFFVRGTGHPCDGLDHAVFVGTFQLHGGAIVFHLFEDKEALS